MESNSFRQLLILVIISSQNVHVHGFLPRITLQSNRTLLPIRINSPINLSLPCEAEGTPTPTYYWKKDGILLDETSRATHHGNGTGTLVFSTALSQNDMGVYQCFALSSYGTSSSAPVTLKPVEFEDSTKKQNKTEYFLRNHISTESDHIECPIPPNIWPTPEIFWTYDDGAIVKHLIRNFHDYYALRIQNEVTSSSVTVDPKGTLWFSHLIPQYENKYFTCGMRSVFGDSSLVLLRAQLVRKSDKIDFPPRKSYTSNTITTAVLGDDIRLWCIFSGRPTPTISWHKLDGELSDSVEYENLNKTLVLHNVTLRDEGVYLCEGDNRIGNVSHIINLQVEVRPYFKTLPQYSPTVGQTLEIVCDVYGKPNPGIEWYFNGRKLESSSTIELKKDRLIITNYNNALHMGNYGCAGKNMHGEVYGEIPVQSIPPKLYTEAKPQHVTEGESITLSCELLGYPEPFIYWTLKGKGVATGRDLTLKLVTFGDAGEYICRGRNKHGQASGRVTLSVTALDGIPLQKITKRVGENATLKCPSTSVSPISWKRDGQVISLAGSESETLTITPQDPPGFIYSCSNGATTLSRFGVLFEDSPLLRMTLSCQNHSALLSWSGEGEGVEMQVEINNEPEAWVELGAGNSYTVQMSVPNAMYEFKIQNSKNNEDGSHSPYSIGVCLSQPAPPSSNPTHVRATFQNDSVIQVSWTPTDSSEQNGHEFGYLVQWRSLAQEDEWREEFVSGALQENSLIIEKSGEEGDYLVKVTSLNEKGPSGNPPETVRIRLKGVELGSSEQLYKLVYTAGAGLIGVGTLSFACLFAVKIFCRGNGRREVLVLRKEEDTQGTILKNGKRCLSEMAASPNLYVEHAPFGCDPVEHIYDDPIYGRECADYLEPIKHNKRDVVQATTFSKIKPNKPPRAVPLREQNSYDHLFGNFDRGCNNDYAKPKALSARRREEGIF